MARTHYPGKIYLDPEAGELTGTATVKSESARQYGSKVVHVQRFLAADGNVVTKCGRVLTDPARDVYSTPNTRPCRDCNKEARSGTVR